MRIELLDRLRGEEKFASAEELIAADANRGRGRRMARIIESAPRHAREPDGRESHRRRAALMTERAVAEIIPTGLRRRAEVRASAAPEDGLRPERAGPHAWPCGRLRKLRQLQDLGHTIVVIVGDWTARIGDPSGTVETRPMLTAEQVKANAETYLRSSRRSSTATDRSPPADASGSTSSRSRMSSGSAPSSRWRRCWSAPTSPSA